MTKSQKSQKSTKSVKSPKSKNKNKKGGGLDQYESSDYKDVGLLDSLKFDMGDSKTARADLPPFPGCSIM
jgi:hypothetical protein